MRAGCYRNIFNFVNVFVEETFIQRSGFLRVREHIVPKGMKITPATIMRTVYEALLYEDLSAAIEAQLLPIAELGTFHCASDFSGMESPSYSVHHLIQNKVMHQWLSDNNLKVR